MNKDVSCSSFQSTLCNNITLGLIISLLITMPLVRGGVHVWNNSLFTLVVLLLILVVLIERVISGTPPLPRTDMDKPIICCYLLFLISLVFARYKPDGMESLVLFLSYIALFYITILTIRTRKQQRILVYVMLSMAIILSVIGLTKRFEIIPLGWWSYEHQLGDHYVNSTYGNHNHIAGYLEMVIPLFLGMLLVKTRRGAILFIALYSFLFVAVTHILTLSRGGWMSLSISLLLMFLLLMFQRKFRSKKLLAAILGFVVFLFLLALSSTDTILRLLTMTDKETVLGLSGRVIAWQGIVEMIADHPLLGSGPGSFATIFTQYQPPGMARRFFYAHNDYLHYISELGLFIVPIICWATFVFYRRAFIKMKSRSRQTWGITLGATIGVTTIIFHSFGDFNLHIPANGILFTVLVAIVMGGPAKKV